METRGWKNNVSLLKFLLFSNFLSWNNYTFTGSYKKWRGRSRYPLPDGHTYSMTAKPGNWHWPMHRAYSDFTGFICAHLHVYVCVKCRVVYPLPQSIQSTAPSALSSLMLPIYCSLSVQLLEFFIYSIHSYNSFDATVVCK